MGSPFPCGMSNDSLPVTVIMHIFPESSTIGDQIKLRRSRRNNFHSHHLHRHQLDPAAAAVIDPNPHSLALSNPPSLPSSSPHSPPTQANPPQSQSPTAVLSAARRREPLPSEAWDALLGLPVRCLSRR
ncbi:unnamed protein product [Linum trigynum]|uniref:Uncharacterized protein n=1 Tax=Linum trigynum TaxID=586398 RepID=A0AAV2FUJ7_9ROSI